MILLLRKTWAEAAFLHVSAQVCFHKYQSMSALIIYHTQICTMLP